MLGHRWRSPSIARQPSSCVISSTIKITRSVWSYGDEELVGEEPTVPRHHSRPRVRVRKEWRFCYTFGLFRKLLQKKSSGDNRSGFYFIKSIEIRLQSSFVCRFRVRVSSSVEVLISVRVANYRGESFVQPFRKYRNKYSSREALFMYDLFFFEGISLLLIWINYGVHTVYLARTNDWI